jgi:DNA-binding transcriptional MerR regulator
MRKQVEALHMHISHVQARLDWETKERETLTHSSMKMEQERKELTQRVLKIEQDAARDLDTNLRIAMADANRRVAEVQVYVYV